MDPNKVKAIPPRHMRTVHLTIRVSPDIRDWLTKNQFSPTAIFHEAIKELGYLQGPSEAQLGLEAPKVPQDHSSKRTGQRWHNRRWRSPR